MADPRFFSRAGSFPLDELCAIADARRIVGAQIASTKIAGTKISGTKISSTRGDVIIKDVAPLDRAGTGEISFLDNPIYRKVFCESSATACICQEKEKENAPAGMDLLISDQPYLAYAKIACVFYPERDDSSSDGKKRIDSQDRIHPTAKIGKNCRIADGVGIGAHAEIGDDVHIGTQCHIHRGVIIGQGCRIASHVSIECAVIGDHVHIDCGARIGQSGFGFTWDPTSCSYITVPQLGRVVMEEGVHIGANTTIDRGSGPDTHIGAQCRIDNLVQIAHNVVLGKRCIIVSQVGISGSTVIGDDTQIGGQAGLSGHLRIGNRVRIAAKSGVMRDIPDGQAVGGIPAVGIRQWHRQTLRLAKESSDGAKKRRDTDES